MSWPALLWAQATPALSHTHPPTYLDPFRACMQGVGPAAPASSHAAQAAAAVSTCQRRGTSASAGPAEPGGLPSGPALQRPRLPAKGFLSTQISSGGAAAPGKPPP